MQRLITFIFTSFQMFEEINCHILWSLPPPHIPKYVVGGMALHYIFWIFLGFS
jgi:hypothetical protein